MKDPIHEILHDLRGCVDTLSSSINIQTRLPIGELIDKEDEKDVAEALENFIKHWDRLRELRISGGRNE